MSSISAELRIILGIIATLAGILSAAIGNVLAINIAYFFTRRGRKPNPRPVRLWIVFYFSAFVSVSLGALAAFAPTLPTKADPLVTIATPTNPSASIRLVPIEGQNIVVELVNYPLSQNEVIPPNETIIVTFKILNNGISPTTIKSLVIGARGPGVSCENKNAEKWSAPDVPFTASENIIIQPGEEYEYRSSRAFYLPGKYFLEPIMQGPNGNWGGIQPFSCVDITVEFPEPTPTPNPTLIAMFAEISTPSPIFTPQIRTVDGTEQVWVPDGSFIAGDINGIGYDDERPFHKVYIGGFWIDRNLVTNFAYANCPEAICSAPQKINSHARPNGYYNVPAYGNYPVMNITWQQASDYCKWRSGRLPSEAEFEKAAGWNPKTGMTLLYPWGDLAPTDEFANYNGIDRDTRPVGSYPKGMSPIGAYDMAGNIWEWISDWYSETYYADNLEWNNPIGPADGIYKVIRGGSWFSDNTRWLRVSNRGKSVPNEDANEIGFRCVYEN